MPTYQHTQSLTWTYFQGSTPTTQRATYHTGEYDEKSEIIKTRKGDDGWRPMTKYSRSASNGSGGYYPVMGSNTLYSHNDGYSFMIQNTNAAPIRLSHEYNVPGNLNSLKIAALNKVKDQKVNLAMTLIGAKSTVTTILQNLKDLSKFVKAVRSGDLVKAANTLKRYWRSATPSRVDKYRALNHKVGKPVAKLWLEINFVHMQLYADVKGLMEELSKPEEPPFVHGRSAAFTESQKLYSEEFHTWDKTGLFTGTLVSKAGQYVQLSYSLDVSALKRASSLGLINVPYIIWDATPLSFVVDWVLPLGSYFNSLDATFGLIFKGGMHGTLKSTRGTLISSAPWRYTGGSGLTCSVKHSDFRRVLISDSVTPPGIRNPFSGVAWKIATLSAMIAGSVNSPQRKPR